MNVNKEVFNFSNRSNRKHFLITGPSLSGKSVIANFIIEQIKHFGGKNTTITLLKDSNKTPLVELSNLLNKKNDDLIIVHIPEVQIINEFDSEEINILKKALEGGLNKGFCFIIEKENKEKLVLDTSNFSHIYNIGSKKTNERFIFNFTDYGIIDMINFTN